MVIPRGILDIDWRSLLAAYSAAMFPPANVRQRLVDLERHWDPDGSVVVCQSVRSGLDLLLQVKQWAPGSEIVMSSVTISEMGRVVTEHGLVPIPVDVDPHTLAPAADQLQSRLSPRTKAILVAHLFGSRLDLSDIARIAAAHQIPLWEDVAQGFAADGFPGDPLADVSFFSFGMIKTQTALGGSLVRFRDATVAQSCRAAQASWPVQSQHQFRGRIAKAMLLKMMAWHFPFSVIAEFLRCFGGDIDRLIRGSIRGFDPERFFDQLRRQPCTALISLLSWRLMQIDRRWLDRKAILADLYSQTLPSRTLLGTKATFPTRWVMPIVSRDPDQLQSLLRRHGYDATTKASQMSVLSTPGEDPLCSTPQAHQWVAHLLFLPLHPALRPDHIREMAAIITAFEKMPHAN